jgi:hypothetical protein
MNGSIQFLWSPVLKSYNPASVEQSEGGRELAAWLSDDIQAEARDIDEWLQWINEVADGKREAGYLGTGNAHSVWASGEAVFIGCEYGPQFKVLLTRGQAVHLLGKYREALALGLRNAERRPPAFGIEYVAEGDEASADFFQNGRH